MRRFALGLALLTAACQPDPGQKTLDDAAAIAAVTEAQRVEAIDPQQLMPADFAQMDDSGASCAFYLQDRALMVARPHFGWIKLDGRLLRFGSKDGSGPLGTRSRFAGHELILEIVPSGAAAVSAEPRQILPAQLVVRDRLDRTVFAVAGQMRCAVQ